MSTGYLYRIAGPVVVARNIDAKMYDVVRVGKEKLIGEVIQIDRENFIIQVYEDTTGLKPKDPVETTGEPLAVELGPGLLGNIYDGIQRPLPVLRDKTGDFIARGATASALDEKRKWDFKAIAKNGDDMKPGQILGEVEEQEGIKQKILVPPDAEGKLSGLKSGEYTVNDVI